MVRGCFRGMVGCVLFFVSFFFIIGGKINSFVIFSMVFVREFFKIGVFY